MNKFTCLILAISLLFMLNACSKLDDEDMMRQDNLEWLDESYSAAITNAGFNDKNSLDEEAALSIDANIQILTAKNMPIGTDTLVYKGSEMAYNAVLTNNCSYTADYTFFIIINGYLQPFKLEDFSEQIYSAIFTLKPNEEKLIHFTFTPISAPYENKALITFAGLLANKAPVLTDDALTIILNSTDISYDMYLTAENDSCQITMKENKNIIGNKTEELSKSDYSSNIVLSDKDENSETVSKINRNELNPDYTIKAFAKRINTEKLRAFLWCDGEFLPVFNGGYYADIPDDEYALYEIPIDNSLIKNNSGKRYIMVFVDMSEYQSINQDNAFGVTVGCSNLYVIS